MKRSIKVYECEYKDANVLAAHIVAAERVCPEIKGRSYRVERHENCLGRAWGDRSKMAYDPYYLLIWDAP